MRKYTNDDWRRLANSPDFDDAYDELYEKQLNIESKQRKKEKNIHASKEDQANF